MKTCIDCKVVKHLTEFDADKRRSDGRVSKCKECRKKYHKQRRKENPKVAETEKKYKQRNLDKVKTYQKEYRKSNFEKSKAYFENYRIENREKLSDYRRTWERENKDKVKTNAKRFRQTEKGKEYMYRKNIVRRSYKFNVEFTPHQRKELLDRDKWTCQSCGIKVHDEKVNNETKAHIDHIIPISKGGNSEPSNLQVLCRTCNLSKKDKLII